MHKHRLQNTKPTAAIESRGTSTTDHLRARGRYVGMILPLKFVEGICAFEVWGLHGRELDLFERQFEGSEFIFSDGGCNYRENRQLNRQFGLDCVLSEKADALPSTLCALTYLDNWRNWCESKINRNIFLH
jgi:hypothetical protein